MKKLLLVFLISVCILMEGREPKIVSLSPAVTEMICHLGGERFLAGRSAYCNYPASVKKLPVMGGFAEPEAERILRLKPDYILTNDLINPSVSGKFESSGIRVIMKQCAGPEDYRLWVRNTGRLLHLETAAAKEDARVAGILAELGKKRDRIPVSRRKRAVWVVWDNPLMIAGKDSLPDSAMNLAGCINIAGKVKSEYFKASPEWLIRENPEIIIWPGLTENKRQEISKRMPWIRLKAVRNRQIICDIPEELLLRPGPRFFRGLQLLQKKVLP